MHSFTDSSGTNTTLDDGNLHCFSLQYDVHKHFEVVLQFQAKCPTEKISYPGDAPPDLLCLFIFQIREESLQTVDSYRLSHTLLLTVHWREWEAVHENR